MSVVSRRLTPSESFEAPQQSLQANVQRDGGALDWSFVDAVYCISLRERDDRTLAAKRQFAQVGLEGRVHFFRPSKHPTSPVQGIWDSHQAIARHALAAGHTKVLIFEDDVQFFGKLTASRLRRIAEALQSLPVGWNIFYLGHWPVEAHFVNRRVLQTRSGCTHAYIANQSLLKWLAEARFEDIAIDPRLRRRIGKGIDAVFASLGDTYALFPMVAKQSTSPSDHLSEKKRRNITKVRHLVTRTRIRELVLSHFMRTNELYVTLKGLRR